MSLVSQIVSFATRLATEFNTLRSEVATVADATLPAGGGTGQILAKVDGVDYNTEWIDNFAPNVVLYAKNETGSTLYKGQAVYVVGADNSASFPRLALADADTEATSSKTVGVLKQDLANGAFGYVITEGLLEGIDTSTATAGASIWLSGTPGGFVYGAPPAKPAHGVYLGVVIRAQANTGKIYVKVQNGFESTELHDWSAIAPSNGQVPVWNSSTGLYTPGSVSAAAIVSETAPSGASTGQTWYKSSTGQTYTYYDGFWVEDASVGATGPQGPTGLTGPAGVYIPSDTPPANPTIGQAWLNTTNNSIYVYWDNTWVQAVGPAGASGTVAVNAPIVNTGTTNAAVLGIQADPTLSGRVTISPYNGTANLQVGEGTTVNQYAYIDFIGDTTYTDYGLRLIRTNGGPNTDSSLEHRGTGSLNIQANEGQLRFFTAGTKRLEIDASGRVTMPAQPIISGSLTKSDGVNGAANSFYIITNTGFTVGADRITVPAAGNYLVTFNTIMNSTTTTRKDATIFFNGTNAISTLSEDNGTGFHYRSASVVRALAANDYIQFTNADWYSNTNTGYVDWRTFSITKLS